MPLYPLGISRRGDISNVPTQAAGAINTHWSLSGNLACVYIDGPHQAVPPMLHAAVVDAIHRRICIVPVRYGLTLHDEAEIHTLLQSRQEELIERLDRLDSTCEMALRVSLLDRQQTQAADPADSRSPLAYLNQRRSHYQGTDELSESSRLVVDQIVERLHGCCREWRRLRASAAHAIRLAFLVERNDERAFRRQLEDICSTNRQWRWSILGPWPPYSFV
jgi:hypothetical protein